MNVTIETKVCTKCGEDKPLTDFHKRSASPDGLKPSCKSCVKAAKKAYYAANREKVAASEKAYREANREKVSARKKAHYEANREKINAATKAYYEANRDEILAATKAYREANREELAAYFKAYREANREKRKAAAKAYREANPEKRKAYHAEKWATDPEYRSRMQAATIRRRQMLANAKQEPYLREEIFARDGWTCGLCQEPIDPELKYPDSGYASIDHIVPLSLGGDDTPANVQAAHLTCNIAKGNRVELEDL